MKGNNKWHEMHLYDQILESHLKARYSTEVQYHKVMIFEQLSL